MRRDRALTRRASATRAAAVAVAADRSARFDSAYGDARRGRGHDQHQRQPADENTEPAVDPDLTPSSLLDAALLVLRERLTASRKAVSTADRPMLL